MTPPSLDGLTAIVAGAGPGIGSACAAALRREGADVVIAARDADRLAVMAARIGGGPPGGRRVVPVTFDFGIRPRVGHWWIRRWPNSAGSTS